MDANTSAQILQVSGALAAGLIALAFGMQKLLKGWKETSTESSVLGLMHKELERMSQHNTTLSEELNKLQLELVTLNKELYKLTIENQRLHTEVASLTDEINRLKSHLPISGGSNGPTSQAEL